MSESMSDSSNQRRSGDPVLAVSVKASGLSCYTLRGTASGDFTTMLQVPARYGYVRDKLSSQIEGFAASASK
jgi:hypothetical protein